MFRLHQVFSHLSLIYPKIRIPKILESGKSKNTQGKVREWEDEKIMATLEKEKTWNVGKLNQRRRWEPFNPEKLFKLFRSSKPRYPQKNSGNITSEIDMKFFSKRKRLRFRPV